MNNYLHAGAHKGSATALTSPLGFQAPGGLPRATFKNDFSQFQSQVFSASGHREIGERAGALSCKEIANDYTSVG